MPDAVWANVDDSLRLNPPVGWNAIPDSKTSHDIGNKRVDGGKTALLLVPSIIVR